MLPRWQHLRPRAEVLWAKQWQIFLLSGQWEHLYSFDGLWGMVVLFQRANGTRPHVRPTLLRWDFPKMLKLAGGSIRGEVRRKQFGLVPQGSRPGFEREPVQRNIRAVCRVPHPSAAFAKGGKRCKLTLPASFRSW